MHVFHVITSLDGGGAQQMLARIATYKDETQNLNVQHSVISLMNDGKYASELREANADVHCLGMRGRHFSFVSLFALRKLLRQKRPDVVMTWLYHADLMGTMASILAGLNPKRVVWNLRCSNIDFAQYAPTTRLVVKALSWMSSLPGAVATNSDSGRKHHAALGYRPRKWVYLPNGLDVQSWRPDADDRNHLRHELGVNKDEILIGMVARVDPQKDHTTFLQSAEILSKRYNNVRFILVGDGADILKVPPVLEEKLIALGYRQDVPGLMRALDVHVLSSAFGEGFPNVVCEAMASGVPCVVTDVGQAAQIVEGVGIVAPPGDAAKLADAIGTIIDEPFEQRQKRGRNSRSKVVREFDIERVRRSYRSVWAELASREAPHR